MRSPRFKFPRRIRASGNYAISALLVLPALLSGVAFRPTPSRAASQELAGRRAAGELDPSFGNGGKVVTDFSGNDDGASSVAIQPDGKIIAAGTSTAQGGTPDFALARYNVDGSLDASFGSNGKVTTDFFQDGDFLHAVAIQEDGRIVAAGSAMEPGAGSEFALARYNPDGSLDTSFGANGKATTSFSGNDAAFAVVVTPAGKIVAVGTSSIRGFPKFALASFNPDGSLDASFGADGKVTNSIAGGVDQARAAILQPDNRIVIAGLHQPGLSFSVFRYNANGSPDTSFGIGGGVITDVSAGSGASALALQSDGKIVAAGFGIASLIKQFFGLARYNPDGSRDSTFGQFFGSVNTSITSRDDAARGVAIQTNGKILAGGFAGGPVESGPGFADFAIVRYKSNGKLDKTFGVDGKVLTDFFGGSDVANAMALQSDGRIVLAGVARAATNVFAVARYLVEDFALAIDPPALTAARGTTASVEVLINRVGGFAGSVTVTSPDAAAIGVKVKPDNPISTTHAKRKVNLKIKPAAQAGVHQLTFKAQDDEGRVRTATLTLNIQ
ncbi:MAG TPA: delta-60 repeat domain-containing protein [Blastocatellia bacterium]|nr:delta-60 repeat domain-containing protein [Blastocatellia bacterium]